MFVEYTEKSTLDAFGHTVGDFNDRRYVKSVPIGAQVLSEDGRTVSLRFAETLEDGYYRVVVTTDVQTTSGQAFIPADPSAILQEVFFEVELGASVAGVVPQPTNSQQAGNVVQVNKHGM